MPAQETLVLSAIGPDRPGLVSDVTGLLLAAGANVADSRMVNLRGHFAVLVLAEGSAAQLAAARTTLETEDPKLGLKLRAPRRAWKACRTDCAPTPATSPASCTR